MRARHSLPRGTGAIALVALSFVLACQDGGQPTAPSIRVAAAGSSPTVSSVAPDSSPPGVTLDVTVNGSGFDRGTAVQLQRGGVPASGITTNSTTFINPKKVVAKITIAAAADTGKYDVAVTTSDGRKGVGVELFTVTYVVDELGIFGGNWSRAHALNDRGEVVGESCLQNCLSTAFYWTEAGGMVDLGTLPGYTRSAAYAINERGAVFGRVVCRYDDPGCGGVTQQSLVRWDQSGGSWTITPVAGCSVVMLAGDQSGKFVINNNDQCVKNVSSTMVLVQTLSGGAVVNEEQLPSVFPGGRNTGNAISDTPLIAGYASPASGYPVPVAWYRDANGSWAALQLGLPGTDGRGWATDISEPDGGGRIRVSGYTEDISANRPKSHAVRWTLQSDGFGGWQVTSLELLPTTNGGATAGSFALAVNQSGDAVGISQGYLSGGTPALWPATGGVDLLPTGSGGGDGRPVAVNSSGWIVGSIYDPFNKCDRAAIWRLR